MELWIRSQDKMNLVQIKQISLNYQNNKQVIANYEPEQYENSSCFYELLGTYKSKERALEVLDEIHQRLINIQCLELTGADYISNQMKRNGLDCVYQMPED